MINQKSNIKFNILKFFLGENYLFDFSLSEVELLSRLSDRSISLVGNARSLNEKSFGTDIDKNEIIIRLNRAPILSESSHGKKTSWIATATSLPNSLLALHNPEIILWMTPKVRKLGLNLINFSSFYLHKKKANEILKIKIGARPSVGLMIFDLIQKSEASKIDIFGFDFFESLSNSGRRTLEQVPHNFISEKDYFQAVSKTDTRIKFY